MLYIYLTYQKGGHYVPAVAAKIVQGNANNQGPFINLQAIGVGNGNQMIEYTIQRISLSEISISILISLSFSLLSFSLYVRMFF